VMVENNPSGSSLLVHTPILASSGLVPLAAAKVAQCRPDKLKTSRNLEVKGRRKGRERQRESQIGEPLYS
ncbi:hypothetical protein ACQP3L_35810, partial [Escherichia coli]